MTKSEAKPTIAAVNELFSKSPDGLREIVRAVMQEMLEAEMTDAVGAEKGERTGARLEHLPRQDGGEVHADSADRAKRFDRSVRSRVALPEPAREPRRVRGSFLGSATAAGASGSNLRRDGSAAGGRRPFSEPSCRRPRNGETASPERPGWRATPAIRFSMRTRSCTRNSRSRCGRFASSSSTDRTTTVRQAPGSPANFAAKTRRSPTASRRSVLARRAPRVTKMLVGSTTWLITPCAVRNRCNQNPSRPASKQLTTSVGASSGGSSRWRRPEMKASSPAPSPASRR